MTPLSFSDLQIFGPLLSPKALSKQLQLTRALLTTLEHEKRSREEVERWRGYEAALALYGFKIALLLRKQRRVPSLTFFSLRLPKSDNFEVPPWMI